MDLLCRICRTVEDSRDVKAARALLADQDLDVLIFADVGMDSVTTILAWSRMAPAQVSARILKTGSVLFEDAAKVRFLHDWL